VLRAHLTRRKGQEYFNRSLRIIQLLEIVKRFFDCIQLVHGVEKEASLSDLDFVYNVTRKIILVDVPIRQFEGVT
jgi:hypothetical protein